MNRNILLYGSIGIAFFLFIKNRLGQLIENIKIGKPKLRQFNVIAESTIYPINSFEDFKQAGIQYLGQIAQSLDINFQNIINLDLKDLINSVQLPPVSFQFDLDLPLENTDTLTIPENSYNGIVSLGGETIGQVNYLPTDIPPGTTTLKTNVKTTTASALKLGQILAKNPNSILAGFKVKGSFTSNGVTVPYDFNINPFAA